MEDFMGKRSITVKSLPFTGRDGENAVHVSVGYTEGGRNWYSGGSDGRGFYAYVTPVEEMERGSTRMMLGAGVKCCLEKAERFNAKKLEKLAASCMEHGDVKRCIAVVFEKYGKAE
jgi:hypothetical protein